MAMATSIATSLRHVRLEPVHFTHAGGAIEVQQSIAVAMVRLISLYLFFAGMAHNVSKSEQLITVAKILIGFVQVTAI